MIRHRNSEDTTFRRILTGRHLLAALICSGPLMPAAQAEQSYIAWAQPYIDATSAIAPDLPFTAVDSKGNIAVAGCVFVNNSKAFYTAKYSGLTGKLLWEKLYNSVGNDIPRAVTFDSAGNVIVTGASAITGDFDYYTVKYASATGDKLWDRVYDGPNGGGDEAIAVAVDGDDNVIVTGKSSGSGDDIYTARYAAGNGSIQSEHRYTSAGTRSDYPVDIAIDGTGSAIVAGVTTNANGDADMYVAKLNLSTLAGTATWTKTIASAAGLDDEGKAVAVDKEGNVVLTGVLSNVNNTHAFYTRKYDPAGNILWSQSFVSPVDDYNGPRDVAVDSRGNVFVTGTSTLDNFKTTYYTAKYRSNDGVVLWSQRSELPENDQGWKFLADYASKIVVDVADNPIVTGTSQLENFDDDYYTVKYDGNTGTLLWANRLNGENEVGDDTSSALAVDEAGGVTVTGVSKKAQGPNFQLLTVKYGRFVVAQKDNAPEAGQLNSGVPENATIGAVFSPAIADNGTVAARVTVAAGKKKLGAIFSQGAGTGTTLPAVQNTAAPGAADALFKSFLDPVIAPSGRLAFVAKLSGVPKTKETGVWSNLFSNDGSLQKILQQGEQVPGMAAGTLLQSVTSVSVRDTLASRVLIALIKVKGPQTNGTVLVAFNSAATGVPLLQPGQALTVNGDSSPSMVKSFSVLNPAAGSPGFGRYQANGRVVAKVTLTDKRTVLLSIPTNGAAPAQLLHTGKAASSVADEAVWNDFGLPAIGSNNARYAALGTLQLGSGDVTKANDTVLAYSLTGGTFTPFAREGSPAPDAGGATFASFLDPLVNENERVAFFATLQGTGVTKANKSGLWWGPAVAPHLLARQGAPAPDADGQTGDAVWSGFVSTTLSGGPDGAPIFVAKLSGKGVNAKNNLGLWAVDSAGQVRQLLRTGDLLGDLAVTKFTVLQATPGTFGAARSYNADASVAVLVTLSNKTQGVIQVAIP